MDYNYHKLSSDAVSMAQDFFLHAAPNNNGPGTSMQIGTIYFKYIAKVLDESLKKACSSEAYQNKREILYSILENKFGLYPGVLKSDLSIFGLSRIKEALYDFSDENFQNTIEKWCKKAVDTFSDAFSNEQHDELLEQQ